MHATDAWPAASREIRPNRAAQATVGYPHRLLGVSDKRAASRRIVASNRGGQRVSAAKRKGPAHCPDLFLFLGGGRLGRLSGRGK